MDQIHKLYDNVWAFEDGHVRSFLIIGQEKALQLDTGLGGVDLGKEVPKLTDKPVILVNTHCDRDHVGGNAPFDTRYAHPADIAEIIKDFPQDADKYTPVEDGFIFDLGGATLQVIHSPGHTYGSITLYYRERGLLFSGDNISEANIYLFGPTRDPQLFIDSLKNLMSMGLDIKEVVPCHGPCPLQDVGTLVQDEIAAVEDFLAGKPETETVTLNHGPVTRYAKCWRHGRAGIMC